MSHAALPVAGAAGPVGLTASLSGALQGRIRVPGDKSISHRALMFGGLAIGTTWIDGLLEGEDVLATAAALSVMGVQIARDGARWRVDGLGVGGLMEPDRPLDLGNAGTATRLLMGILATHPFVSFFTGDGSLRSRPMRRVTEPLGRFGARFVARSGDRLPLALIGAADPVPVEYLLPVASAQVKSAVLLAGLNTPGRTTVIEPIATRDHTERMLRHFGARIAIEPSPAGSRIAVEGHHELHAADVLVPGDPSSAAFPLAAAAILAGSDITLEGVGTNPARTGFFQTLIEMGADLQFGDPREQAGEPVADLRLRHRSLKGVTVPPERAPSMIDEYPALAMVAACAEGTTRMLGVAELTVKESDRLTAVAQGLAACGVRVEADADSLTVHGTGRPPAGGARIAAQLDHRIAMAFLVLGLATADPITIDDARTIDTSFPGFADLMRGLGGRLAAETADAGERA